MSSVRYVAETDIAVSREAVYERVASLQRHGEWSADPLQVEHVAGDEFRSTAQSKGKTITATLRVLERLAPERFVFEATDLTGSWVHTFELTQTPSGTHVRREITGKLGGAQLALFWLVLLPVKKPNARKALEQLRQAVEAAG